jgi:hypothetical protein
VKPLDAGTWEKWRIAWRRSRQHGRDFAEYLNQVGLLLTPARRAEMLSRELRRAALDLENASPAQFIKAFYGSNTDTALDMQRATVAWLRERADLHEDRR